MTRSVGDLKTFMRTWMSKELDVAVDAIDTTREFWDFGLNSARAIDLTGELEEYVGRTLSLELIWDFPTIDTLAEHLAEGPGSA